MRPPRSAAKFERYWELHCLTSFPVPCGWLNEILAGGVTLDHLKCQVFEWLDNVRRIYDKARAEGLDLGEPDSDASPPVIVH